MPVSAKAAQEAFTSMKSGAYGVVNHSAPPEFRAFSDYLDFLHSVDPKGTKSRTVSAIIEEQLLPEKRIADSRLATDMRKEVINKPQVEADNLLRPGQKFLEAIIQTEARPPASPGPPANAGAYP
ncbi:MAG: hypothetical protein D3909_11415 [Candidatus Electrothrix sp. ATG1]|nr:hypothetical protein [Candidatus Electrothrix sp. ATG1]